MRRLLALALAVVAVAACDSDEREARRPTTTTTSSTTTTAPTTTTVSTAPVGAVAACPPVPPRAQPSPDRPRYTLHADVRPGERIARGDLAVSFTPDLPTDRLVFRLWPNGPRPASGGAHLDVGPVTVGGRPARATLDAPTVLVVHLDRTLAPGETVEAALPWTLRLPGLIDDRLATVGESARLGSFFPILSWEPGVGWGMEPPTSGFAEAAVSPTADFDVTVTTAPGDLVVLTSGVPEAGRAGHFTATAVRDFALSVGRFTVATAVAHAPGPVQVTVGVDVAVPEAPGPYLARVVRALEGFAGQFGPYPWPTFTLALTAGLRGGIEYPAHVMQGPSTRGRTTPHEVAHQWFFGLVGNDQGRDPWLDEGLASYAEARSEGTLASFRTRSIPPAARGHAGEPMTYWESRQGSYYRGVYVQPVQALTSLGDVDHLDCALRVYVARQAYAIARPRDLFAALGTVFPRAVEALAPYGLRP